MRARLFTIAFIIVSNSIHAQQPPQSALDIEQFIEEIFAVQNGAVSSDELFETLLLFYSDPIDLNNTTTEELRSLFILSENQLRSFINYQEKNGRFLSLYELQAIPDFDLITINKLLPFVTVRDHGLISDNRSLIKRMLSEPNNYLLIRYEETLENKAGFKAKNDSTPAAYLGGSGKYYTRFRASHSRDFSIGFTAEKDAGEQLKWNSETKQYGADFYSGHIQVQNQGRLKNIVIGDYQIQFGQSLIFGSGFNVGKGAETITTVRRSNVGIRPYTSVIETNFFRGGATTIELNKNTEATVFYSRLNQDASQSDTLNFISSIQQSGFHRTRTELSNKNTITEQNYGGTLLYNHPSRNFSIGSNILFTDLSKPLIRADRVYNRFEFSGSNNYTTSLFADWNWQNFSLFGEFSRSESGGLGGLFGLIGSLSPKIETSILLRNYEKDFHTFYGNAFGESTRNINESGWYWGLKYTHSRQWLFTAYFDSFKFPWLRAGINAPSTGYEYLGRITYRPTREIVIYAQLREQSRADNPSANEQDAVIRFPVEGIKRNYLVNFDYPATENISFKTRVQWSSYDFNSTLTEGYAVWQDVNLSYRKFKLSGRMALFDTDDFENAQYAFERDVLYAFSVPAYNGLGTRQYILLQYSPTKKLTFWLKYARTSFRNRDSIGSGNELINGNKRTDIRGQVRINF